MALANTADDATPADLGQILGLSNELQVDEHGWAVIPYGDSRHGGQDGLRANAAAPKQGVIQRFTKADAEAIVADFKSTWSRIKRAIVGLPIFKGHPDAPAFANMFPDKTPRGTIADMEAGDKGLRLRFVLTDSGADEVEAGWNQFSPFWAARKVGLANDGAVIASPFKLFSVGIVPRGNIPGLSLINAAPAAQIETTMKEKLIKLLALLGITVAADASDDALIAAANSAETTVTALNQAKTDLTAANTAKGELETAKTKLEGEKLSLANSVTTEKNRADTAEASLKEERKQRSILLVNAAILEGRLTAAERDATVTALCNAADYAAEETKLAQRKKALKTTSSTGDLAGQRTEAQNRQGQIHALVNAAMETPGIKAMLEHERYDAAFNMVMTDPKNAALVGAMKKPEVVAK